MNWARARYQTLYLTLYGATPWSSEGGFHIPRSHTQIGLVQSQHFHHQEDLLEIWHLWGLWILEKREGPSMGSPYYVSASQVALAKEPACQCRRHKRWRLDPWVRKISWTRAWQPHSNIHAWRIPWTREPSGLESIGSQTVGHDWGDLAYTHYHVSSTAFGSSQLSPLIFIDPPWERWYRNSQEANQANQVFPWT